MRGSNPRRTLAAVRHGLIWLLVDHEILGISFADIARKHGVAPCTVAENVRRARLVLAGQEKQESATERAQAVELAELRAALTDLCRRFGIGGAQGVPPGVVAQTGLPAGQPAQAEG